MAIVNINAEKKAEIDAALAALHAAQEADLWYADQVMVGFTSTSGIRLGISTEDVALLTGNYVLAKEADNLSLPLPPVIDADGESHSLSLPELTALMLEYGQHRAGVSAEYAQRKAAIPTA